MEAQKEYNDDVFEKKLKNGSKEEKLIVTNEIALKAHRSLSELLEEASREKCDQTNLAFASVDALRYIMSILNVWDINSSDIESAYKIKDAQLSVQLDMSKKVWQNQPVIIVDIDDVLAEFRGTFADFLVSEFGINADPESKQYYFVDEVSEEGFNPEAVFQSFVEKGMFRNLPVIDDAVKFLNGLKKKGYWIHLLTARPKENKKIFYDTFFWLKEHDIPFDDIDFSPEKFRWCAQSKYYDKGGIYYAIDDSPKHAIEYAKHGIRVKVPVKSYNTDITNSENIEHYNNLKELMEIL
jgi:5'(3')-deoxyribonucleotidase